MSISTFYGKTAPCSIFVVRDNVTLNVMSFLYVSLKNHRKHIDNENMFLPADMQFEQFKYSHLSILDPNNLPDQSFLRFDICKFTDWKIAEENPKEYIQNQLCYNSDNLTEKHKIIEEYQLLVFKENHLYTPIISCYQQNQLELSEILHLTNPFPYFTREIVDYLLGFNTFEPSPLNKFSDTQKKACLDQLRSSKLYMQDCINESTPPFRLDYISPLHILTALLKGESEKADDLRILYNMRYALDDNFTNKKSEEFINKELEFMVKKYCYSDLSKMTIPDSRLPQWNSILNDLHPQGPDSLLLLDQLKLLLKLSDINQNIRNCNSPEQYNRIHNEQKKVITELISPLLNKLNSDIEANPISPAQIEAYYCLDYNTIFLDDHVPLKPLLEEAILNFRKKANLLPQYYNVHFHSFKELKNSLNTHTVNLSYGKAYCIACHGIQDKLFKNIINTFKKAAKTVGERNSIITTCFHVSSSYILDYEYRMANFCRDYLKEINLFSEPHLIVATPYREKTEIQIICSNRDSQGSLLQRSADQIYIEEKFQEIQRKYSIPLSSPASAKTIIQQNLSAALQTSIIKNPTLKNSKKI